MTTPERLKRRQLVEGTVLILLAICTVLQAIYFNLADSEQRKCFQDRFEALSAVSKIRGDLNEQDTESTRKVLAVYADKVVELGKDPIFSAGSRERVRAELIEALQTYQAEAKAIQDERRRNPVPPYPIGVCKES